jgi:hypothetical protein
VEANNFDAKQKALQAVYGNHGKPQNGHVNSEEVAWENG